MLDASVLANLVGDDGADGRHVRAFVQSADVSVPDLADVETVAVLRERWIDKAMTASRLAAAVGDLAAMPFRRCPAAPLLRRIYELRSNVTAFDATYVALAEALACDLWTADARLARASGPRCGIELVTAPSSS